MASLKQLVPAYLIVCAIVMLANYAFWSSRVYIPENILRIFIIFRFGAGILSFFVIVALAMIFIKQQELFMLTLSLILFQIGYMAETFSFLFLNSYSIQYQELSRYIFMASQYAITIAPFLLMYFVVSYFKQPRFWEFSPVIFDILIESVYQPLGLHITNTDFILEDVVISYWIYQPRYEWVRVAYVLSIFWITFYILYLSINTRNEAYSRDLRNQQRIFQFGIISIFVLAPIVFTLYSNFKDELTKLLWLAIAGRTFVLVGIISFVTAYIQSSEKLDFFHAQPLDALYIFDMNREKIVFGNQFRSTSNLELADFLVNNYNSLNSMVSEVIQTTKNISSISVGTHQAYIKEIRTKNLAVILIVRYMTSVILARFEQYTNQLEFVESADLRYDIYQDRMTEVFKA